MTKVIFGPEVWAKLSDPQRPAELCDESGRTRGYYFPAVPEGTGPLKSPYSDEELRRWAQEPGGRPLKDILADLAKR